MKFYNKSGNEVDLLQGLGDITITTNIGYELLYNYSYKTDKLAYIICGIKKTSGVFDHNDNFVATMNVKCILGTCFCGLGKNTNWLVNSVGYTFISGTSIIISDRNGLGQQDRAYINLVCRLDETST